MRVAVIGGGIGGLSAALHLLQAGIDVQVYELAPRISEIGAGIQISPNASRLLVRLGLRAEMDRIGILPLQVLQRRWDDGRLLQQAPLGPEIERTFGAPYYHFHRADLARLLAAALPPERVHVSHRLVAIEEKANSVVARFENGASAEADVLVGADGIHSRVLDLTFGVGKAHFTGCVCWRGLVPGDKARALGIEVAAHNWMGPDGHAVHYWVSGGKFLNVVFVTERGQWTEEGWTVPGRLEDVAARYAEWHSTIRGLIAAMPQTFVWALHDRTELPHWSRGRVTLLGDACHPMLPFMAQGASQSIEDGAALAALLKKMPDAPEQALQRYEEVRKPRATRLQLASSNNRTRFHLHDGPEQQARDHALAHSGDRSVRNIGWLYDHDAALV